MKAVLRSGADINFRGGQIGTALHELVVQETKKFTVLAGRDRMKCIDFLLEVGADPGIGAPGGLGQTPIGVAVTAKRFDLAEKLLRAPLGENAMKDARRVAKQCASGKARQAFRDIVEKVQAEYSSKARPVVLCQCTSGRPAEECHFNSKGAPLHPKQPCPCKRNQDRDRWAQGHKVKPYGKCCMKSGAYKRETFAGDQGPGQYIVELPVHITGAAAQAIAQMHTGLINEETAKGLSEAEAWAQVGTQPLFPGMTEEVYDQGMEKMYGMFLPALVESGECDPAFAYATNKSDFMHARPWRGLGRNLEKGEMELRGKEWNASIDEYAAKRPVIPGLSEPDVRPLVDIERCAKVCWTGGALYATCSNPPCGKMEKNPGDFKMCSKCKMAKFCTPACAKAAWKECHKAQCGRVGCDPRLPSEVVVTRAVDQLVGEITQHGLGS